MCSTHTLSCIVPSKPHSVTDCVHFETMSLFIGNMCYQTCLHLHLYYKIHLLDQNQIYC